MQDQTIRKLLEGIRRYGLENISTLSKWIDIPVETARYMIWNELPKYNIDVGVSINFQKIGLFRWILEFKPKRKEYTMPIQNSLRSSGILIHSARMVPDNSSYCILVTPSGEVIKLREELERAKREGIFEWYSLEEVEWARHLSFDATFYDFKRRHWDFKWEELEMKKEPLLLTPISKGDALNPDYKDILILKELRTRVPRTLSKLSHKLKIDQHNLRYHYKNHAKLALQGYFLKLGDYERESESNFKFTYEIASESSLIEAQSVAVSIPFTNVIRKTVKTYEWNVTCPGEYVNGLLSYVNQKFIPIQGKLRLLAIDGRSIYEGAIPSELFDKSTRKWVFSPKISLNMPKLEQKSNDKDSRKAKATVKKLA